MSSQPEIIGHQLLRRGALVGIATTVMCAPAIVRAASLMPIRGLIMPMGELRWELDHPGEPYPYEGFCRRLFFSLCESALRDSRSCTFTGKPLTENQMRRVVFYARRYGFLNEASARPKRARW